LSRTADAAVLARYGFRAPERALDEVPPGWRDDPAWMRLLTHLGTTADPDAGLRRLRRLGEDVVARVLPDAEAAVPLLRVVGYSEYLTELLTRTPGLPGELLGDPPAERGDVRELRDAGFVRIAAGDLSSSPTRDSFVATTRALSDLADACLARVLDDERNDEVLGVLGMGKHGAQELNYASDIDVLFVTRGGADPDAASGVARRAMARMTGPPVIFRTDADLRPEGRDGPLVRSLDSYRAYYSRWAEVWEFQALIKCRFAAGSAEIGRAFVELIEPFVWPDRWSPEAIEQIRELKARAEREVARRGQGSREVKLGRGGIRDVEFAVQLLQLVHGRHHPQLRVRSTLDALDVLSADGFVAEEDAKELVDAYVFLRHVEHRLQLEGGRQTHTLPASPNKREHLARALGFTDAPARTALDAFEDEWSKTTATVRTIHERLFYRPLLEAFAAVPSMRTTMPDDVVDERLAAIGFDRPPRVREAIGRMTSGGTRRAKVVRAILPGVLSWMAETPEPDQGMLRLADVAKHLDAMPHLLAILRDEPPVVELLCRALGTGPVLAGLLERDASLIGSLATEVQDRDLRSHAVSNVRRASSVDESVRSLRRMKDGHMLRLAARDLAAGDEPDVFVSVAAELSDLGDACLDAALDVARREQAGKTGGPPDGGFGVVAMGRFGGREMNYASDLDVIFVYEHEATCPDGTDARLFHSAVAERVMQLLASTPPIFKVDAELRPEGRSGPIVRSLESSLVYYDRWAQLWEFQALTRARPTAGDLVLGRRFIDALAPRVWRTQLGAEEIAQIRRMKARIERERVKGRQDPRYQVKLGLGGLADVEFTVQLLQMRHGHTHPTLRTPNTLKALEAVEKIGLLERRDATWLLDAYLLLNRVRNHMYLVRGLATDALPERDEDLEKLSRSLGYGRLARARFLEHYRRTTRRARRVTDRVFYGEDEEVPG
jgi:[glutamine synthetase] adenylyltransferase / [glutamine synthetase]-adenylyl-L-tyrosine phosphorylase